MSLSKPAVLQYPTAIDFSSLSRLVETTCNKSQHRRFSTSQVAAARRRLRWTGSRWKRKLVPGHVSAPHGSKTTSAGVAAAPPISRRQPPRACAYSLAPVTPPPANGAPVVRQRHGVPRTATAITWRGKGERARARRRLSLRWGARADVRYC